MDNVRDKLEMYKEEVKINAEIERVNVEIEKINAEITSRKQKIFELRYGIRIKKERIEINIKELRKAEEEYKNERRFLTRLKKRGNDFEINRLKHSMDYYKETIEIATKESEEKESEIKRLEEEIKALEEKLSSFHVRETTESIFKLDEKGRLIIDGSIPVKAKDIGFENSSEEDLMMVHVTNFFPQNHTILNNYNGNKIGEDIIDYEGVKAKVSALSHRHTVHFTLNNVVHSTGDGAGTWGREKYIVLEPFKYHTKDKICALCLEDSFIYGDIHFGDGAILLVRKEAYGELSEEIKNSYNIVLFEGSAERAVKQMLVQLGYPIFDNEAAANAAGHSHSPEGRSEDALNSRDLAINYMFDANWDGKSEIKLSEEDVINLFKIITSCGILSRGISMVTERCYGDLQRYARENNFDINFNVLNFIIGTGLYKASDGSYSFKSDDEVYETIKKLYDTKDYEINFDFYKDFIKLLEKHSNDKKPIVPLDTDRKISDLASFKNHQMARSFVNEINNIFSKYVTENNELVNSYSFFCKYIENDGIVLGVNVGNNLYDFINGNYNVLGVDRDDNYQLFYDIKITGSTVGEVLNQVEELAKTASNYFKQNSQVVEQKQNSQAIIQDQESDIPLDMNEKIYKVKEGLAREINSIINSYQTKIMYYPEKSYDIKVDYVGWYGVELTVKVGVETYDFIKENYSIKEAKPTDFVKPFNEYKISIEGENVGEVIAKVQELVKTASDYVNEETKSVTGRSR